MDSVIVLKYQKNFADNLSSYAYGKIFEKTTGQKCCYKNHTAEREKFEDLMSNFNLQCRYISDWRLDDNENYLDYKKFKKEINSKKIKKSKTAYLDIKHFQIDDISSLEADIKKSLDFSRYDFIKSHDILEDIKQCESVGLYINKNDYLNGNIDYKYISNALKRLNKYLKKQKLFVFSHAKLEDDIKNISQNFEIITLNDFQEEFYFLSSCHHKIILNTPNSYSAGFWAAVLKNKDYSYTIYDKKLKPKRVCSRWIGV